MSMSPPQPLLETVLKASFDGPITAYDSYTGTVLARFNSGQCPRNGITVVGDNQFASSHVSPETGVGSIHLYYWWSPSCTQNITLPEPVAPLAASVDGSYLFSGGVSGRIHSLMVPSGELIRSFPAHQKSISCIAISCDESLILSGSDDGTIAVTPILMLLDSSIATESKTVKRFVGHDLSVTGIAIGMGRSDGIMISSSLDWTCKVWGIATGTHLQTVKFPGEVLSMALDPSETELYAAGTDGLIYKRKLKVETRKQVICAYFYLGVVIGISTNP
ncbi:putative transcription factor WD40-like family [Helianthus annuus]|nr:putative transcription factor WD40-like family [Helianthus annuus]